MSSRLTPPRGPAAGAWFPSCSAQAAKLGRWLSGPCHDNPNKLGGLQPPQDIGDQRRFLQRNGGFRAQVCSLFGIILAWATQRVKSKAVQSVSAGAMPGPDGAMSAPTGASRLGFGSEDGSQCSCH